MLITIHLYFLNKKKQKKKVDYIRYLLDSASLENECHQFTKSFSS